MKDTLYLFKRYLLHTIRMPIWIAVNIIQPIFYLTIFSQLFSRVADLPGFAADSYLDFLTPGVVIMTAMFGSFWSGMGLIDDMNEGVMDRLLVTPVHRFSIIAARVLHAAGTVVLQGLIIIVIALILGTHFPGGVLGVLGILLFSALLGCSFSALSNGLALITRRDETLIAIINFFGLPLMFLSTAFMASELMPDWIRLLAQGNPVNWAVHGSRLAMAGDAWLSVLLYAGLLLLFAILTSVLATQAFRFYRRSI